MLNIESDIKNLNLSSLGKRSIFKLAVDLVKADNRIHKNEIAFLDNLQNVLGLPQEDLDMIHYTSMQQAISALSASDTRTKNSVISFLSSVMRADSDIDFEEALLLSSVEMVLGQESSRWSSVITAMDCETETPTSQIIYIEKVPCEAPHKVFDDKYDNLLITKTLSDIGFDLFYLPTVLDGICQNGESGDSKFGLLKRSMEYLVPAGDKGKITNLESELQNLDIPTFSNIVLSQHGIRRDFLPYDACLLIRLKDSRLLDDSNDIHKAADLLCIDISTDVKRRILDFVSRLDTRSSLLLYEGYFKMLFDFLSSEAKTASRIVLDDAMDMRLKDIDGHKVAFESAPQAKTFYLLMLKYGQAGVSQECFNDAVEYLDGLDVNAYLDKNGKFDILNFQASLLRDGSDKAILIFNTVEIYKLISTKDTQSSQYLSYVTSILKHRSSLKTYINTGFLDIPKLSTPDIYCVQFDKDRKVYYLPAGLSFFSCTEDGQTVELKKTAFWKRLK